MMKTAERTLDVFEIYARVQKPLSLSELAENLMMPVSSCFGLVRTIESRGYLASVKSRGPYYPTRKMLRTTQTIAQTDPISVSLLAAIQNIRDKTNETVVLGIQRLDQVVYIDVLESDRSVRYSAEIGEVRPLYANSIGKALLSTMDKKTRAKILENTKFDALTPGTITSFDALEDELEAGLKTGYFKNIGESSPDVSAVACALEIDGRLYGLSVVGPRERMLAKLDEHAQALIQCRDAVLAKA